MEGCVSWSSLFSPASHTESHRHTPFPGQVLGGGSIAAGPDEVCGDGQAILDLNSSKPPLPPLSEQKSSSVYERTSKHLWGKQ